MPLLKELDGFIVVSCEIDLGVWGVHLGGLFNSWIFFRVGIYTI